jgi:ribonuclease HI
MIYINTDGGSRGNPGDAAWGFAIFDEQNNELFGTGKKIGINTNNVAEYMAVIEAFEYLLRNRELLGNSSGITVRMDSLLVCQQMNGLWKVKHANMVPLYQRAKQKALELEVPIAYKHVPREQNKIADSYVNKALDNLL